MAKFKYRVVYHDPAKKEVTGVVEAVNSIDAAEQLAHYVDEGAVVSVTQKGEEDETN